MMERRNGGCDPNDYVFRLDNEPMSPSQLRGLSSTLARAFNRLLIEAGLLKDKAGHDRTLYSLRHTYATFRILYGGINYPVLAANMGTSIAMLERHYAHVKPTQHAALLAG